MSKTYIYGVEEVVKNAQLMEKTLISKAERNKVYTKGRKPLIDVARRTIVDSGRTRPYQHNKKIKIHSGNLRASIGKIKIRKKEIQYVGARATKKMDKPNYGWRKGASSGWYAHIAVSYTHLTLPTKA